MKLAKFQASSDVYPVNIFDFADSFIGKFTDQQSIIPLHFFIITNRAYTKRKIGDARNLEKTILKTPNSHFMP